ncbi:MAG: hypothetical protein HWQ41_22720 [Nostoc sp. NOS(2021)]|uniref:hypothetical protein n=1 Tax=Nostoc sp. NOS(2021) TaxID=2815407 RepID=UPI0025FF897A|nr:hypothetical protein [Nostoc sp. NOS(2021)]MBN3897978.1 hypothetical protein [Nostoc sp. NOS(2021)]
MSQIIDEVKKVKLPSHKGFSDSDRIAKKMDQVELSAIALRGEIAPELFGSTTVISTQIAITS